MFQLAKKNRTVKRHNDISVASDDLSFHVVSVSNGCPIILQPLIEDKGYYEPLLVRDFAPIDRRGRYQRVH